MAEPAVNLLAVDGVEAQQSVIGSMLIDSRCVGAVVAALREEDFSDPSCRNAFAAIRDLFLAGKAVDPVTLVDRVNGGQSWIAWARGLMEITPTAANVLDYVEIVRDRAALARFRALCEQGLSCVSRESAQAVSREIAGVFVEVGRGRTVSAGELAAEWWRRITRTEKPKYLPWGLPSADQYVTVQPGDYVVLGGYPSAGKTLLSVQMALAQAAQYRTVYYTLETQPEKMADRIFARLAQIPLGNIKSRNLDQEQFARAAAAAANFAESTPVDVVQAAWFTAEDIAADAVSKGAEIIYIDYLQLVQGEDERDRDYTRVSRVSRKLKLFGQSRKIAVVALAQLARPDKFIDRKTGKRVFVPPSMSSFRESGQIEQDADAAFLLWRYHEDDNKSPRILKLGKNKEGERFSTVLDFDGPTQTMTDLQTHPDDYFRDKPSVMAELSAQGRAVKRANRAKGQEVEFQQIEISDEENPFLKDVF